MQEITQEQLEEWEAVTRGKDGREKYAEAQFNLGVIYYLTFNELDSAKKYYSNILDDDDDETYAKAQIHLASIYHLDDKNIEKAKEAYLNVKIINPMLFAWAQLNLAKIYEFREKNYGLAKQCYMAVPESEEEAYINAQYGLGYLLSTTLQEFEIAKKSFQEVIRLLKDKESDTYACAQLGLGDIYFREEKYLEASRVWKEVSFNSSMLYHAKVKSWIADLNDSKQAVFLESVFGNTSKILELLFIGNDGIDSKVAHYTTAETAYKMLDIKNGNQPSLFRINTIQYVNDPTEGAILLNYLGINGQRCHLPQDRDYQFQTFIACFSFNHDWLNQFRLYGKTENQEASGVSLVFEHGFFDQQHNEMAQAGYLKELFIANKLDTDVSHQKADKEKANGLKNLSLYRCIYFDFDTGFLKLARRNEWTFFREMLAEKNTNSLIESSKAAQKKWAEYLKDIEIKEKKVLKFFESIKKDIDRLLKLKIDEDRKNHLLKVLGDILLPIRFLVKHMAFREEQECRIFHVTNLNDTAVKDDFDKKWLYIDYKTIREHLDKIYLAPEAVAHQNFFIRALDEQAKDEKGRSRVRLSQNPFRNPVRT